MYCSINLVFIAIKKGTPIREIKRISTDLKKINNLCFQSISVKIICVLCTYFVPFVFTS